MSIFFRIIILISFLAPSLSMAEPADSELKKADSLFQNQKYTEALEQYQSLHDQGIASAAMLIKMAYINEGLGNEVKAIYYLDQYYKKTNNRKALEKLREIANEHNLAGYEYSDEKFFINRIRTYRTEIIFSLLFISAGLLVAMFIKKATGNRALPWIVAQAIIVLASLIVINQGFTDKEAIISEDHTLLMQGPSSASETIRSMEAGNKVNVIKSKDVWTQVEIDGNTGFIKSNRLQSLL